MRREQDKLRNIPFSWESYGIFEMRTVGPSAEIRLESIRYKVYSEWIGQNVEVRVYPQVVKVSYCGKSMERRMLGAYLGPELVSEGRCLILYGSPGTGKTPLSIVITLKAIQTGSMPALSQRPR